MRYPLSKYKFFVADNMVIAVSTYAGKIVKGRAKCDPRDEFDLEKGKELAAGRCALKIAEKRKNRAIAQVNKAMEDQRKAVKRTEDMVEYLNDATKEVKEAKAFLGYFE